MVDWNQTLLWGNSLKDYIIAAAIIVGGILVLQVIKSIVLRRLHKWAAKTETSVDDLILDMLKKGVLPLLYLILVYIAVCTLQLNDFLKKALDVAMVVVIVFFVVRVLTMGIKSLMAYHFAKQGRAEAQNATKGVVIIIQVILWVIGLVFLLGNLGYNITTILAGMGIGGIAIALAAQTILGDIFAYFSILFDRPFEVGEFLIIEDQLGTVIRIGIKTTRIQSLSGEELSYSNQNMLNQWIHNYSRMEKRRAVFGFNVSYDTPVEKLERIPEEVKKIILAQEKVTLDRVHFAQFQEYNLYFEGVYYSMEPGYGEYMDKQQKINLAICRLFEEMDVKFAFSTTRNVYLHRGPGSDMSAPEGRPVQ